MDIGGAFGPIPLSLDSSECKLNDIEVSGVTKLKDLHQLRKRCLIHFEQKRAIT
jgi:hypothetical protein